MAVDGVEDSANAAQAQPQRSEESERLRRERRADEEEERRTEEVEDDSNKRAQEQLQGPGNALSGTLGVGGNVDVRA